MMASLWEEAVKTLDPKLQNELQTLADYSCGPDGLLKIVKDKRDECRAKQWTCINRHGRKVYVRDILENMTFWLDKLKSVGDVVASFDPVHAALPWAGARFLLMTATSDIKQYGAMMESLEVIVGFNSRYMLIEQMYCRGSSTEAEKKVRAGIIEVYSAMLKFLCEAYAYFGQNLAKRIIMSFGQLAKESDTLTREVTIRDAELQKWTRLVDKEIQTNSHTQIGSISQDVTTLKSILLELEHPLAYISSSLEKIQDGLEMEERRKIMKWISIELFQSHHKTIASHRLAESGSWLLNKSQYQKWKYTTRCPVLWLKGDTGSGKSVLTSLVIDDITKELSQREQPPPVAYFYCSNDSSEPHRSDDTEVLLSILRQLACSSASEPIHPSVVRKWQERLDSNSEDRLDREECVSLITELSSAKGAFIILDALDECSKRSREDLLNSLDEINQNSSSLVRIFLSSRPNANIRQHFNKIESLEVSQKANTGDIFDYVNSELEKKIKTRKLLGGTPSEGLVAQIKGTLINQADGNFRWVAASIQTLCALNHEVDVREALGSLPTELNGIYEIIINQIHEGGSITREIAKKALCWLLCAQQPLCTKEFISALSNGIEFNLSDDYITKDLILDVCCNFVKHDAELDIIRFVHLSVREYLETEQPEYTESKTNASVALACLNSCSKNERPRRKGLNQGSQNKTFYDYAMVYWPLHCSIAGECRRESKLSRALTTFLYQEKKPSVSFLNFLSNWTDSWNALELVDNMKVEKIRLLKNQLDDCDSRQRSPIFLACAFGFKEILEDKRSMDTEIQNFNDRDPFLVAITHGQKEIVEFLTSKSGSDDLPFVMAVYMNHEEIVFKLLEENSELQISHDVIIKALMNCSISLVKFLIDHERCVDWEVTHELLLFATLNTVSGDEVVETLLSRDLLIEIEDEAFEEACRNSKFGTELLQALLQRNKDFVPTEAAIENAAANEELGIQLLNTLFQRNPNISITEQMIEKAAGNSSIEPLKFLCDHDPDFRPTAQNLLEGCYNTKAGNKILPLLLKNFDEELIDQFHLSMALNNRKFGDQLIDSLLKKTSREQLPITTDLLVDSVGARLGDKVLERVLEEIPGISIDPIVALVGVQNAYTPVEILNLLLHHDPQIHLTVDVCIEAAQNSQYAVELIDCLQPICEPFFQDEKFLEVIPSNSICGYELVQRFWRDEKPEITDKMVENAVSNKNYADKILVHWYEAKCKIPITAKAVEMAFDSTKAVELFQILTKIDRKLPIPADAICNAATNYTKATVLLNKIIRHVGKSKIVASDELFGATGDNFATGGEVIKLLKSQLPFSITPAVIEHLCTWAYEPSIWKPLLEITRPSSITPDAIEYAFRVQPKLVAVLQILLEKNPKVDFTQTAWELLYCNQRNEETISATLECLGKYGKTPQFSDRLIRAIMLCDSPWKIWPSLESLTRELGYEKLITTEVIHVCVRSWTEKGNPTLELLLEALSNSSIPLEMNEHLYREILYSREVEGLLSLFKKFDYTIPVGPLDSKYMRYAIANSRLKDDTLEDLFGIDSEQRKELCRTEENLIAIIEVNQDTYRARKLLAGVKRPLPITSKVLIKALILQDHERFLLQTLAEQDSKILPEIITEEVLLMAFSTWSKFQELHFLSLRYGFDLPITSKVLKRAMRAGYYFIRILIQRMVHRQGPEKILTLLNAECLVDVPMSGSGIQILREILFIHLGKDKIKALYSEPILTTAAGCGDRNFIDWIYDDIPNAKPKQHYIDISDLYYFAWNQNLVRARLLLNKGVDPNTQGKAYRTILATACDYGELCVVKLLLKYPHVDVNVRDERGMTPLMIAAENGSYSVTEELLKRDPEKYYRDLHDNRTAEEMARYAGNNGLADMIRDHNVIEKS